MICDRPYHYQYSLHSETTLIFYGNDLRNFDETGSSVEVAGEAV